MPIRNVHTKKTSALNIHFYNKIDEYVNMNCRIKSKEKWAEILKKLLYLSNTDSIVWFLVGSRYKS